MKLVVTGIVGFAIGVILTLFLLPGMMAEEMLIVAESNLGFEETVTQIETNAVQAGWKVPKVYNLKESLAKDGHEIENIKILSLCQPEHAYNILKDDSRKKVSAIMPCRVSVYETKDGKVMVGRINSVMMSKMFGGVIEEVMGTVSKETEDYLKEILKAQ